MSLLFSLSPAPPPPVITTSANEVAEDEDIILTCNTGINPSRIRWTKISGTIRDPIIQDNTLTIQSAVASDSGMYECGISEAMSSPFTLTVITECKPLHIKL